jgi:hypothetical protein
MGEWSQSMKPDDIANAVSAALSVGATAGATEVAKKAIADGYEGLKSLIKARFGGDSKATEAINSLEARPSEGRKQTLSEELDLVNAASYPELASAARSLLELVRALPQGERHIQFAQGSGIAIADRSGTASVTMAPPRRDDG